MIRGDILSHNENDIPLFFRNVLKMNNQPSDNAARVASFNLINLDYQWNKDVNPSMFHSRIRNRLAMGMARHRYIDIFKYFNAPSNVTDEQKQICERLRKRAMRGPFWDLHPLFKSQTVISNFGSLNKTLINFIFEIFSEIQVNEMKRCKYLPYPDHRYTNYNVITEVNLNLIGNPTTVNMNPTDVVPTAAPEVGALDNT